MGRHFFTGGMMPSADYFEHFTEHFRVDEAWSWPGTHYQRTAEAWLDRLDARRDDVRPILAQTYGPAEAERWRQRWRVFFMACAELFGYAEGSEWLVRHTRLRAT